MTIEESAMHVIAHYGYIALFIALILGLIGLPVPDEVLLAFAGYLIAQGDFQFTQTLIVCFLGSVTGMSISFFIGRKLGIPFLFKYKRFTRITPLRIKRLNQWFTRFGKVAVIFGYFLPGIRHFSAYIAGVSNWSYRTFIAYAVLGAALWSLTFIFLGMWFEEYWEEMIKLIHRYGVVISIVTFITIILFMIIKIKKSNY
ncbi:hypothetical protein CIB95_10140 [Lottiidibacillus patelloidae]|uniref:VTT domain-containing protein n=1 Tax=Lottiidibacillus patelloidae TaxID=2670334 RepID=A0A263BSA8_9BACI|nr:DedA family protein [Lottiidibacillus patelloidae]OZM56579.1 hypothetical protein CIB95_10140 [Lottiidibacillus patelloidae]